jgi:hypothetical protein
MSGWTPDATLALVFGIIGVILGILGLRYHGTIFERVRKLIKGSRTHPGSNDVEANSIHPRSPDQIINLATPARALHTLQHHSHLSVFGLPEDLFREERCVWAN